MARDPLSWVCHLVTRAMLKLAQYLDYNYSEHKECNCFFLFNMLVNQS